VSVNPIAVRAFGAQAEAYERGRPGWPADAVARLIERFGARAVVDLAAGTGKLTRILAEHADVTAIEPVDGMRRVLAQTVPTARVMAGTAEAIPLPDGSVDAVFVAEAFHWFDLPAAAAEIKRVLRPGGWVAVLFNETAGEDPPWFKELGEALMAHRLSGTNLPRDVPWREALTAEFGELHDEAATHEQVTTRELMLVQIASFSSIGALPPDRFDAAIAAFREILERHGIDRLTIPLRTEITTAQKRSGDSRPSAG
jgi:ubiquinone/menaquinone biosynthesis C-methylase UbiE